jgi:hypothetical protein
MYEAQEVKRYEKYNTEQYKDKPTPRGMKAELHTFQMSIRDRFKVLPRTIITYQVGCTPGGSRSDDQQISSPG